MSLDEVENTKELLLPDTQEPCDDDMQMEMEEPEKLLPLGRILIVLLQIIIGVGMLGLPYCFRIGALLNTAVVFFIGSMSFISFIFLIDASSKVGCSIDFCKLMVFSFERNFSWLPLIVIFITLVGFAIVHLQYACRLLQGCLCHHAPAWFRSTWCITTLLAVVIDLPLMFLRNIRGYAHVSIFTCVLILLYIIHSAYYLGFGISHRGFDPEKELVIASVNKYFVPALAIQAFAYACHPIVGPTMDKLRNPTTTRKYLTMGLLCLLASCCYTCGGILPYLTLFEHIKDPVIFVYYGQEPFTVMTEALYAVFLTATSPLILYQCRMSLNDIFWKSEATTLRWNIVGVIVLGVCTLLAITVKEIMTMFDLVGGVTCTTIIYILPSIYYLRICGKKNIWKTVAAFAMIPIGVASMSVCLYHSIGTIVHPSKQ
jgi:hypothetical protein